MRDQASDSSDKESDLEQALADLSARVAELRDQVQHSLKVMEWVSDEQESS